jgi:hypothetical protein
MNERKNKIIIIIKKNDTKARHSGSHLSSQLPGRQRSGESRSRPAWTKN